ncbi:MAG: hypothetical protein ACLUSP_07870 [Christensenellales bacterium]
MKKYVLKRILLMIFTLFVITTLCFVLIKLLEPNEITNIAQKEREEAIREALGYNQPILVQYFIYLKNIFTKFDFSVVQNLVPCIGKLDYRQQLFPTVLLNVYSLIISIPLGILLGSWRLSKRTGGRTIPFQPW